MSIWKNRNVLISGGAGVIGMALVDLLYERGARLFVGDLKQKPAEWPSDIAYREGDLNEDCKEELLAFQPEIFFHLAATFERSSESYDFWRENFHHNVLLSHRLISQLKDCPSLKRVIFASSYLVYDPSQYLLSEPPDCPVKLAEQVQIQPRNLCGAAKLMHEQELRFLQAHTQWTYAAARIFRSYGRNSRDIISRWIRALIQNQPLTVYQPQGLFDFIFADDVAEGLMRLAETDQIGVFNLGTGEARTIAELLEILRERFPEMKTQQEESDLPYEASEADMTHFYRSVDWMPTQRLEETLPKIIAFEYTQMQKEK